ncbi:MULTISPECIES: biotin/lipoyl-containing protein [unclassified Archaeoglobus]|jgi:biotin carboxyl carrier protein|uniref:biotin/lipoyl-containing protein n=1 Tax=unclassified Archaeoglobus TaxID=2643606 RepID=UPI0025BAE1C6|nr:MULTISPECIES: biotin/lipoyl-containing protein [unclassified Archaeoglobus]
MKFYRIRIDGTDFKVGIEKLREGLYRVKVGEKEAEVVVEDIQERTEFAGQSFEEPVPVTPTESSVKEELKDVVTSMLPGVVLKILVKPGDRVQAGDPIIIVESMKMENEIVSHKDGVVSEILVKEGQRIEAGDVLAVIE